LRGKEERGGKSFAAIKERRDEESWREPLESKRKGERGKGRESYLFDSAKGGERFRINLPFLERKNGHHRLGRKGREGPEGKNQREPQFF